VTRARVGTQQPRERADVPAEMQAVRDLVPAGNGIGHAMHELHRALSHWSAGEHGEVDPAEQRVIGDELAQKVGRTLVHHEAERALGRVLAHQHDRMHEVRVEHLRYGEEQARARAFAICGHGSFSARV
jgi:hypothetical protein